MSDVKYIVKVITDVHRPETDETIAVEDPIKGLHYISERCARAKSLDFIEAQCWEVPETFVIGRSFIDVTTDDQQWVIGIN